MSENPRVSQAAHTFRHEIASWRDKLIKRQQKDWDESRQKLIDKLGEKYREVYQIALDTEVSNG